MRKWRPTHKCMYVIPEIHGNMDSLEVILNRVLPLRIFKNQEDTLIFLGDYVDGDGDGPRVLDCLIAIKKAYNDRVIMVRGNHEEMMIRAVLGSDTDFQYWIDNGGALTIEGYLRRQNLSTSPYAIGRNRLRDIIPQSHLDFISSLDPYSIIENYLFFHGGFNVEKNIHENAITNFYFDNTSSKYVKECVKNKVEPVFKNDFVYVGSHNYMSRKPFLHSKYLMLGGSAPQKLMVFELNSMSACAATKGKSRIYKYNFSIYE